MNDGEKFWNGPGAKNYPTTLKVGDREVWEPGEIQRRLIGEQIRKTGWIKDGEKLDLGAGPSTKWIYGEEEAAKNVWAVDFSSQLLAQSGVPPERRILANLTTMTFPKEWDGKFVLSTTVLLFRYLNRQQRIDLMVQAKKALSQDGRLVIVDFSNWHSGERSQEIGEVEPFDVKTTEEAFKELGYTGIESGLWDFVFEDARGDQALFSIDWVTANN